MKKSEQTRAAIMVTALNYFCDHPFRDLTVGELMSKVGASRATFYQYFNDLHDLVAVLLEDLRDDIMKVASPWFIGDGEPLPLLKTSLAGLVDVCIERGPLLRAVTDAAGNDADLERAWGILLTSFDDAVTARIEQHQALGWVASFPARPVAIALSRLNAALMTKHFGYRPQSDRDEVLAALTRIWCLTLYERLE